MVAHALNSKNCLHQRRAKRSKDKKAPDWVLCVFVSATPFVTLASPIA
jgi:hypothetical protein